MPAALSGGTYTQCCAKLNANLSILRFLDYSVSILTFAN